MFVFLTLVDHIYEKFLFFLVMYLLSTTQKLHMWQQLNIAFPIFCQNARYHVYTFTCMPLSVHVWRKHVWRGCAAKNAPCVCSRKFPKLTDKEFCGVMMVVRNTLYLDWQIQCICCYLDASRAGAILSLEAL